MTLILAARSLEGMCFTYDTLVEIIDDETGEHKSYSYLPKIAPLPGRDDIVLGWAGLVIGGIEVLYEEVATAIKGIKIFKVKEKIIDYITSRRARKWSNKSGRREGISFIFGIADGTEARSYVSGEIDAQPYREIDQIAAIGLTRDGKVLANLSKIYRSDSSAIQVLANLNEIMEQELEHNHDLAGKGCGILTPNGYLRIA